MKKAMMYFDGVTHTRCGGDIGLDSYTFLHRVLNCSGCKFQYECEEMERPIEAVYRFIADGVFEEGAEDDGDYGVL